MVLVFSFSHNGSYEWIQAVCAEEKWTNLNGVNVTHTKYQFQAHLYNGYDIIQTYTTWKGKYE